MSQPTLFDAIGGLDGVHRLTHAWHLRVLADEVVSHAFSHGFHPQHTERLAAYWCEAWGGPKNYTGKYGTESSVVRMHSGNGEHEEMDRRAIHCFELALTDVEAQDQSSGEPFSTTSHGQPPNGWRPTRSRQVRFLTTSRLHIGPGMACRSRSHAPRRSAA